MTILQSKSTTGSRSVKQDAGRRSFLYRAGAALSAGLAAAVPGMAKANNENEMKSQVDSLSGQVARLEAENAILRLHAAYENLLDSGRYGEVAALFTDDAEVIINGGVYRERKRGVSRLYGDHFKSCTTGKRVEPPPGFPMDDKQNLDVIELSEDGRSARARFAFSIQAGAPMDDDSVLVKMARLQGEGIRKWWEGGIYEIAFVQNEKDRSWKISRLEHRVLARSDHKPGRSKARPVAVAPFTGVYPADPTGPDELIAPVQNSV